jgi:NitT/TauT family transport system ATP-binding protein
VTAALAAPPAMHAGTVPPALQVRNLVKDFGHGEDAIRAIDGIDLEVRRGEFVCLVGASGCGKSTLLALLAGLDRPSAGLIVLADGRPAIMFQEPALFPWLSVERNVELPLQLQKVDRAERRRTVADLLRLVHLEGFGSRRPHELSGGMRQRVALARALAQGGDLLLMDEPFAALDAITRDVLHDELTRIVQETGVTVVFVTHNVREAVRLGDRVVLLSSRPGRVVEEFEVGIDQPRRIEMAAVAALAHEITEQLRAEISSHGTG